MSEASRMSTSWLEDDVPILLDEDRGSVAGKAVSEPESVADTSEIGTAEEEFKEAKRRKRKRRAEAMQVDEAVLSHKPTKSSKQNVSYFCS